MIRIETKFNSLDHFALIRAHKIHSPNGGMQIESDWALMRKQEQLKQNTYSSMAFLDNKPIGAALLLLNHDSSPAGTPYSHLVMVFVKPSCRGRKLGKRLISRIIKAASIPRNTVFALDGFHAKSLQFWAREKIFSMSSNMDVALNAEESKMAQQCSVRAFAQLLKNATIRHHQQMMTEQGFAHLLPKTTRKKTIR